MMSHLNLVCSEDSRLAYMGRMSVNSNDRSGVCIICNSVSASQLQVLLANVCYLVPIANSKFGFSIYTFRQVTFGHREALV